MTVLVLTGKAYSGPLKCGCVGVRRGDEEGYGGAWKGGVDSQWHSSVTRLSCHSENSEEG